MSTRSLGAAACCGAALLAVSPAHSQPNLSAASSDDRIVVTASRMPMPRESVLADVTVIDRQTIERAAVSSLPELLQQEAGVEIATRGGPGQPAALFLRGSNASHVLLLIDGVRVSSATAGTSAFEHLSLDQIERIEVLRGAASSLYGADAIGGVIQVFTRQAAGPRASLALGSDSRRELGLGLGGRGGDAAQGRETRWSVQGSAMDVRPGTAADASNTLGYNPDRDPYSRHTLAARLEQGLSRGHSLTLQAQLTQARTEYDVSTRSEGDRNHQRLSQVSARSSHRLGEGWTSRLMLAHSVDDLKSEGSIAERYRTAQDQFGWEHELRLPVGRGAGGLEWRREVVSGSTAFTETARRTASVWASWTAASGPLSWQASARQDRSSQYGTTPTGSVSAGYTLAPGWKVSGSAGSAFKAPSFNDLYFPFTDYGFGYTYQGNPLLRPERAQQRELALRGGQGAWSLALLRFDQRIRDLITSNNDYSSVANVARARVLGSTAELGWQQGAWRMRAQFTRQDPRDTDSAALLPRRAREFGSVSLGWTGGAWRAGLDLSAQGERFNDPWNTQRLPGYALVHGQVGWRVAPGWDLAFKATNLGNVAYSLTQGYPGAGRQWVMSLAWNGGR